MYAMAVTCAAGPIVAYVTQGLLALSMMQQALTKTDSKVPPLTACFLHVLGCQKHYAPDRVYSLPADGLPPHPPCHCCAGVGRTGWHIDGSFMAKPFAYSTYHIVSCPSQAGSPLALSC